jgi:hypothetical protein
MRSRSSNTTLDREIMLQRIRGEFLEMPGLRLTCGQAQRLWALDEQTCRDLLECLVHARFLSHRDGVTYSRISDVVDQAPLRMAHATAPAAGRSERKAS